MCRFGKLWGRVQDPTVRTSTRNLDVFLTLADRPWLPMPPETTILKVNNAPAAALVHHFGTCVFVVLVLESIQYSNPTYWSESYREPPRSTIGIAAVRTAIEYEYRFTEYRFAE